MARSWVLDGVGLKSLLDDRDTVRTGMIFGASIELRDMNGRGKEAALW